MQSEPIGATRDKRDKLLAKKEAAGVKGISPNARGH
jgi:hypothetical protein